MKYDAVVGFSVNAELELAVKDTPGPKKVLKRMDFCLSGSSGNVVMALKKLGSRPHLLGLVTARSQKTLADKLLGEAIVQNKVSFTPIRVLSQSNICVIPVVGDTNGVLWGKRNQIVRSAIPKALRAIQRLGSGVGPNTFTVITGLRAVEVVFAKTLLEMTQTGFRVLNAKDTLCERMDFERILPLVDLLVLNRYEFNETGMELSELHGFGRPKIIVVTDDEKGGMFSFHSGHKSHFKPVSFRGGRFETGAGDWFLGAMISELVRLRKSVDTVSLKEFQGVVDFAAKVAGKKITMPGGGNGPTRFQLRN